MTLRIKIVVVVVVGCTRRENELIEEEEDEDCCWCCLCLSTCWRLCCCCCCECCFRTQGLFCWPVLEGRLSAASASMYPGDCWPPVGGAPANKMLSYSIRGCSMEVWHLRSNSLSWKREGVSSIRRFDCNCFVAVADSWLLDGACCFLLGDF